MNVCPHSETTCEPPLVLGEDSTSLERCLLCGEERRVTLVYGPWKKESPEPSDRSEDDEPSAEYVPVTVGDLIDYLQQFDEGTAVFLDIESAGQEGYDEDHVQMGFISLSFALGEMEENKAAHIDSSGTQEGG